MNDLIVRAMLALLVRLAPADDRDEIVGDLAEEWADIVVPERGERTARAWLVHQVVASAPHLLMLRWRRGEMEYALAGLAVGLVAAGIEFAVVDVAWHTVLSQVPLRAAHAMPPSWVAAQLGLTVAAGVITAAVTTGVLESLRRRTS